MDTNGGLFYFWDGTKAKSAQLNPESGLLKVKLTGEQRDGLVTFYLTDYKNPTNYLADSGVNWTETEGQAAKFTAYVPSPAYNEDGTLNSDLYAEWTTKPDYLEPGENTVRFDKGGPFLNTSGTTDRPSYSGGKGGFSYWFAYAFTEEEADALTADNVPKMIDCHYEYQSPLREDVFFEGMHFKALEGVSINDCRYENTYASNNKFFQNMTVIQGENQIISEDNHVFRLSVDVDETWTNSFSDWLTTKVDQYGKAQRVYMKPGNQETYVSYSVINDGDLRSKNPNKLFDPGHMWYLDYVGLDPYGHPLVKMMSVQFPGKGLEVGTDDNSHASVSDTPSEFAFFYSINAGRQEEDFCLGLPLEGTTQYNFLNDRSGYFSTWKIGEDAATNDLGSVMRFIALEDAEFDEYEEVIEGCGYDRLLESLNNGVVINEKTIREAKESRDPAKVTLLFPENMNLLNGLRTYKDMTGLVQLDNAAQHSIPGYVSAATCKALYDAIKAFDPNDPDTDKPVAEARWALVDGNPAINMEPTLGAIYTIQSTDTDTRGYLCNTNGQATSTMGAVAHNFDAADPDFQFTFVKVGDTYYMYNLGAAKFMNAFGDHTDIGEDHPLMDKRSSHTWRFDDMPTPIRTIMTFKGVLPHSIAIAAGMTSGSNEGFSGTHEGGITVIAGCNRNLLVSMGVADRGDGNGLYMAYAGALTDEQLAEITTKAEEAIASVPAIPTEFEQINGVVNHFTDETHAALSTTNGGTHDHIAYLLENGTRQQFDDTKVYNLFVDANTAYKYDVDTDRFITAEFNASDATFNVKAVKATAPAAAKGMYYDGEEVYSFTHTYDKVAKSLEIGGNTQHTLDMSELGKVKIGDQVLTAKVGTGEAVTTQISEITAGNGADVIYDLQGRRMAAPVKGINIINGKKVRI